MRLERKIIEKFVKKYYENLEDYEIQNSPTENTVETAFKILLIEIGKELKLTLIKESIKSKKGNNIIPDGILKTEYKLTKGIWEAKDISDDLETEIKKKIEKGYPLQNAIFENTQKAILYQGGYRVFEKDIRFFHIYFLSLAQE